MALQDNMQSQGSTQSGAPAPTDQLQQIKMKGIGTDSTGFVQGKYGPFDCAHCEWFDSQASGCNNDFINQDPQVASRLPDGRARVEADDCSNHFWPTGLDPAEYLADQQGVAQGDLNTRSPHGFPPMRGRLDKYLGKKKKSPSDSYPADESNQRSAGNPGQETDYSPLG